MPRGLNRTGNFRNGTPISLPHEFGNPITESKDFGNQVNWSPDPAHFGNPVTWSPDPAHFGNPVGTQVTPTFSPVAGSYGPAQSVMISSPGATAIYYTLDGSTPTTSSTLYTGAITVSTSETLKAIAVQSPLGQSAVGSATYTINGQQATPTFSPIAGAYGPTQNVTITSAGADTIYYTTNGSTPTTASTVYSTPVAIAATGTLKALAVKSGWSNSAIGSAAYTINGAQATPTFSPVAGTYSGTQSVSISSAGADTIYYTTDGSTPTTGSTVYSGAISVAASETVKALAVKANWSNSAIGSAAYTITSSAPVLLANTANSANAGTGVTTGAIDTTGATLLLVAFACYGGSSHPKVITDSKSNNWHLLTEYDANGNTGNATASIVLAYAFDSGSSQPLVVGSGHTFTGDDGFGTVALAVEAWSNTLTTASVFAAGTDAGQEASTGGGGTLIAPGAATPTDANDIVVSALGFAANSDPSIDTGFTISDFNRAHGEHIGMAYLLAANTTPVSPTWTIGFGGNMASNIAVFKHA